MKSLTLITAALCLIAAPLAAQQDTTQARRPRPRAGGAPGQRRMGRGERGGPRGDDMMAMMREMMAPLMPIMAYTPDHLLDHRDSLKLTSDQVTKLTAIRDSAKAAHDAAASDMKTHMDELSSAFQSASPDTNALRPHVDAAQAAMGKAHWAMLAAAARSKAVLTDDQRKKVDASVNAMMQRERPM
jgi:Spy/CpxP family protein refolding chaperone